MSAIYWATADVLIAAARLGSERDLPPPDDLRATLLDLLGQMVSRCRAAGIPDAETAEARYALVAFIDERILKSSWPGRAQWMSNPLQLQLYREYAAGENFFARLRVLLQRGEATSALEVYYLCLSLGFTGAAGSGGGLGGAYDPQPYLDAIRPRLVHGGAGGALSPHAIPTDHETFRAPRPHLLLALGLSCTFVVATCVGLLAWSLGATIARTRADLAAIPAPAAAAAPR